MSPALRRVCVDYALHVQRWYFVPADYEDDDWLKAVIADYISIEALKGYYARGGINLTEFEWALGIKLGLKSVPSECPGEVDIAQIPKPAGGLEPPTP